MDIYALEPRLLLDAAAGVTVIEATETEAEQALPDGDEVALNSEQGTALEAVLAALDHVQPKVAPDAAILFVEQRDKIVGCDVGKFADSPHAKPTLPHGPHRSPAEACALLEVLETVKFTGSNGVG